LTDLSEYRIIGGMTPSELITYFKTQALAARALGCAQSSISGWVEQGHIPDGRQYQIQLATEGRLLADRPALRNAVEGAGLNA